MRLIDADKIKIDCMTNVGTVAVSQSQLANAPTYDLNEIRNNTIDEIYDILYKEYYDGFRGKPGSKQRQLDFIINGFFIKLKDMKNRRK